MLQGFKSQNWKHSVQTAGSSFPKILIFSLFKKGFMLNTLIWLETV